MNSEEHGNNPASNPKEDKSPIPTPIPKQHMATNPTDESTPNESGALKRLVSEVRLVEVLALVVNAGLAIIGVIALCIYGGQLAVMRGTLEEMKRSGSDSTNQVWQAVGNINWMASTTQRSFEQSQRAMNDTLAQMKIQSGAMRSAAYASRDQITLQNRNFQLEQRPYIVISQITFRDFSEPKKVIENSVADAPLAINIVFQNVGKSPALELTTHRHLIFRSGHIQDIKSELIENDRSGNTAAQGDTFNTTAVSIADTYANETARLSKDEIMNWNGRDRIILFGRNSYTDMFGNLHCDPFMLAYLRSSDGTGGWLNLPILQTTDHQFRITMKELCPTRPESR